MRCCAACRHGSRAGIPTAPSQADRMTHLQRRLLPLAFFGAVLIAWEIAVRGAGQSPATSAIIPYPTGVLAAGARTIADGSLAAATAGSLSRVLLGFAIGGALGIPLGISMGFLRPLERALG